jgi:hypothetical protein
MFNKSNTKREKQNAMLKKNIFKNWKCNFFNKVSFSPEKNVGVFLS